MSQVYNPEAEQTAEIERLELEARSLRRRIDHARNDHDKQAMGKLLQDLVDRISHLQDHLPH